MASSRYTDHLGRPLVAVTGMGVITSLGRGIEDNWKALTGGVSGIHAIRRFPTEGLATRISGTVDFLDLPRAERRRALFRHGDRDHRARPWRRPASPAISAAPSSWRHLRSSRNGRSASKSPDGRRRRASLETSMPAFWRRCAKQPDPIFHESVLFGAISERLADRFGTRGLPVTLSTACASGATAIQLGIEAIRQGRADRALTVATDGSVNAEALIRFSLLSALSTQNDPPEKASKPFTKNRDGFVIAEGAATLVLESLEAAEARGAKILGIMKGCGEKADHFHRTRSSPDGGPAIACVREALADAGLGETGVGYVNAHGTSTPENDKMEYLTLSTVFGEELKNIPVSSNKSMIGHTLTAAGAIEAVFSLMTMRTGTLPPTINYDNPDPAIELDVVPNVRREQQVTSVLSNSFGFGGQNACLVMTAEPA